MSNSFLAIYNFFDSRRVLMYCVLVGITVAMGFFASRVSFSEDITTIFPQGDKNTSIVFKGLKVKDKLIIMVSPAAVTTAEPDADRMVECGNAFVQRFKQSIDSSALESIVDIVDDQRISQTTQFIYDNLPILLTDADYARLDSLTTPRAIGEQMERNYQNIVSPMGGFVGEYIYRDPIGISGGLLAKLQKLNPESNYQIYDSHIFASDMRTMLMFVNPRLENGKIVHQDQLVDAIESSISSINDQFTELRVTYFGGPAVATYNARQIKYDTWITLNIALVLVSLVITLAFRNKWAIALIILPVIFGGLFAMAMIYLFKGSISAIAAGSGAAVFGIAMSYSIHVMAHSNNTPDPRQIIREMAYPLTVGSFTTIGAFLGLLFTTSPLLQDFGLFASMTLIGTTLFSLIFLPHFISGNQNRKSSRLLIFIEKINDYAYDRNRWLIGGVVVLTVVCLFFYNDVRFDSDMMNLNYQPRHLVESEEQLKAVTGMGSNKSVLMVSVDDNTQRAIDAYHRLSTKLDKMRSDGRIVSSSTVADFLVGDSLQSERLDRWNNFWNESRISATIELINQNGAKYGFREGAFDGFEKLLRTKYAMYDYSRQGNALLGEWVNRSDSTLMFISNMVIADSAKEAVYETISQDRSIVVADRSFYAGKMAANVTGDFNLILFISSILILGALLISFGRIELTIMAFLPMVVSWIIILGLMAIFGVEFNLVNIILSTFIFGIGDDFSIFIIDGLQSEYRNGRRMLSEHKTAIFFSAFALVVGMGSLIFAAHPALRSIALISIFGMLAVVIVSYTVQPVMFRFFVSSQTRKGGFPYTMMGFLNTVYAFGFFITGCFALQGYMLLLHLVPMGRKRRKLLFHRALSWSTHFFLRMMITGKMVNLNDQGEDFKTGAVIIANHQSFIDILILLGLNPKIVMVTNSWVWRSPFFGRIVRYADFYHTQDGYDNLADTLREKVADGYSVLIFPEGTRSKDNSIGRFHKGAFYLAEKLRLDILPILVYGNGLVSSKSQPLYIKKGLLMTKILPRITPEDIRFGEGYRDRTKSINRWFHQEYHQMYEEYNRSRNKYFRDALLKNYIYKGPVLEWYMRIKIRMERNYQLFDQIVPRSGQIVDIGCGYGPLTFMLSMLSDRRRVVGIDYDQEKIDLANHSYGKNERIEFVCADVSNYELPTADCYVMNDVLHYMDFEAQDRLLGQCIDKVSAGGVVIVRDGDSSKADKHRVTETTEKWSTRIMGFNKTDGQLHFTSTQRVIAIAEQHGAQVKILENDTKTSNTIYIITRNV